MKMPSLPFGPSASSQKNDKHDETYWEDFIELPRADIDRVARDQRKMRYRRWFIWAAMGAGIVSMFASCSTTGQMTSFKDEVKTDLENNANQDSPGRFAATQAVRQWLASSPSPLPGGELVNWSGARQLKDQSQDNSDGTKVHRELDTFTLVDGFGRGYSATIEVAYTDDGQAAAITTPSLVPRVVSSNTQFAGSSFWPGLQSVEPTGPITTAVQQWSDAYTSGDAPTLRQAVGDPNRSHIYVPVQGIEKTRIEVVAAADTSNGTIAQVKITPRWEGRNYQSDDQLPSPMTFDVLIKGADTAAPRVVAWGAPGAGPGLKEYSNAIVLSKAQMDNGAGDTGSSVQPSEQPTATPSAPATGEGKAPNSAKTEKAPEPSASSSSSSAKSSSASSSSSASATSKK